ncbi:hypothetical protein MKK63_25195 [Methylobacterium sp. J-088]|uniref:hypothetical protein n=1 Tax=Methylobacterium sp. J-088 TaxID=2836664 RepID=UPI001FBAB67B|nr:hypothetical protein [Methylobacterium sp. J-088]MCJ2065978.1 hypothetical protein [Methylobacterium sp. J-088]
MSLRTISEHLGVPYRSVQNYVGGETRMPADFLLNVCAFIGIEPEYLMHGDFYLRENDLYDALAKALERANLIEPPMLARAGRPLTHDEQAAYEERLRILDLVTTLTSEQYERFRREWLQRKDGGRMGRRDLRGRRGRGAGKVDE